MSDESGGYHAFLQRVTDALTLFAAEVGVSLERWRGPALRDEETAAFVRAVDAGIVALEPDGVCTFPGLRATMPAKRYQLFATYEGGARDPGPVLSGLPEVLHVTVGEPG
jgi:hypothetical protein